MKTSFKTLLNRALTLLTAVFVLFGGCANAADEIRYYNADGLIRYFAVQYGDFTAEGDAIKCFGSGGNGESESGMVADINLRSDPVDTSVYKFLKINCLRESDNRFGMRLRLFFSDGTSRQNMVYVKNDEWYSLVCALPTGKNLVQLHIAPYPDTPAGGNFYVKEVSFCASDTRSEEQISEDESFIDSVQCEKGEIQEKGVFARYESLGTSEELLTNPSFDTLSGWTAANGATLSLSEDGVSGNCVKVSDRTDYYSGIKQDILPVLRQNGAGNYKISAHIKTDAGSADKGPLFVRILLKKNGKITYYASSYPVSDIWDENVNSVYIPYDENVTAASFIVCGANSSESEHSAFYADECSLKRYNDAPGILDEPYNAAEAKRQIAAAENAARERKTDILNSEDTVSVSGTRYYVSMSGNDENPGTSPNLAWRSADRVKTAALSYGDGVFFERGGVWRGVSLACVSGVTYAAYGEGEKPKLLGSDKDYADPSLWQETDVPNVWKTKDNIFGSAGFVSFNNGEKFAKKVSAQSALSEDFTFYDGTASNSPVYVYSSAGNPGSVYDNIEIAPGRSIFSASDKKDCVIDNLCLMYTGWHGIRFSYVEHMSVTNCVIGYIGGTGETSRWGNGIEFWNSSYGSENRKNIVKNNYIFEIYDAALTNQYKGESENPSQQTFIEYSGNLIEYATYGFEFFSRQQNSNLDIMKNITVKNNIVRSSGFGWGEENRPVKGQSADVKGWESKNRTENFSIENNIFYMPRYAHIDWTSFAYNLNSQSVVTTNRTEQYLPSLSGNTFINEPGKSFGKFNGISYEMNYDTKKLIRKDNVDQTANVFLTDDEGFCVNEPEITLPDKIESGKSISASVSVSKNLSGDDKKIKFSLCLFDGIVLRAINTVEYTCNQGAEARIIPNSLQIPNGIWAHCTVKAFVYDENLERYIDTAVERR